MTSGVFEIDDDFQQQAGPSSDDDEISEEVNHFEMDHDQLIEQMGVGADLEKVSLCQATVNPKSQIGPSDFDLLKVLGKGGYGKVFQVSLRMRSCYSVKKQLMASINSLASMTSRYITQLNTILFFFHS